MTINEEEGVTLYDLVEARVCGLPGDSGGAWTFSPSYLDTYRLANGVHHGHAAAGDPSDPDVIPGCSYVFEGRTYYVTFARYSKWGNIPSDWGLQLDPGEGRPKSHFKGNYCPDILGRRANGKVYARWGNCNDTVATSWTPTGATGTLTHLDIFSVGDWSGRPGPANYCTDLVARTASGSLVRFDGNCPLGAGAVHSPTGGTPFNTGWGMFDLVFSPGDWTGNGCSDLMARTPSGDLFLYQANCVGGLAPGSTPIGAGWNTMTSIFGPGDFSGDGCPDVVARTQGGTLLLYRGNCAGGWVTGAGEPFNTGWQSFTKVFSPGDISGDECPDILAVSGSSLRRYRGDCQGGLKAGYSLMTGNDWNAYNLLW